jgi:hypothetical protein
MGYIEPLQVDLHEITRIIAIEFCEVSSETSLNNIFGSKDINIQPKLKKHFIITTALPCSKATEFFELFVEML